MTTEQDLWYRKNFFFRKSPMLMLHGETEIVESIPSRQYKKSTKAIVGWLCNFDERFKHAFIMLDRFEFSDVAQLLASGFPIRHLQDVQEGLGIITDHENPIFSNPTSYSECVFTGQLYIFTHFLGHNRHILKNLFKQHQLNAIIIDDERWKLEWDQTPSDLFICHDSRDQPGYARPLYNELAKRNMKVWYSEYSVKLGHDFVEKIDRGLAECRHAVLLITKRFLQNKGWASQEMRALLARQFAEGKSNLILPVWVGVNEKDVREKSPLLAKANAHSVSMYHFRRKVGDLATRIQKDTAT